MLYLDSEVLLVYRLFALLLARLGARAPIPYVQDAILNLRHPCHAITYPDYKRSGGISYGSHNQSGIGYGSHNLSPRIGYGCHILSPLAISDPGGIRYDIAETYPPDHLWLPYPIPGSLLAAISYPPD